MTSTSHLVLQAGLTGARATTDNTTAPPRLADDLLEGAEEIAEFMFGDRSKRSVRKVYYLASETDLANRPPIFKLGKTKLAGRRLRLLQWIAEREAATSSPQAA